MRDFNLEEAKNGAKVCTRGGKSVKILTFNNGNKRYPISVKFESINSEIQFGENGKYFGEYGEETPCDLMMED